MKDPNKPKKKKGISFADADQVLEVPSSDLDNPTPKKLKTPYQRNLQSENADIAMDRPEVPDLTPEESLSAFRRNFEEQSARAYLVNYMIVRDQDNIRDNARGLQELEEGYSTEAKSTPTRLQNEANLDSILVNEGRDVLRRQCEKILEKEFSKVPDNEQTRAYFDEMKKNMQQHIEKMDQDLKPKITKIEQEVQEIIGEKSLTERIDPAKESIMFTRNMHNRFEQDVIPEIRGEHIQATSILEQGKATHTQHLETDRAVPETITVEIETSQVKGVIQVENKTEKQKYKDLEQFLEQAIFKAMSHEQGVTRDTCAAAVQEAYNTYGTNNKHVQDAKTAIERNMDKFVALVDDKSKQIDSSLDEQDRSKAIVEAIGQNGTAKFYAGLAKVCETVGYKSGQEYCEDKRRESTMSRMRKVLEEDMPKQLSPNNMSHSRKSSLTVRVM